MFSSFQNLQKTLGGAPPIKPIAIQAPDTSHISVSTPEKPPAPPGTVYFAGQLWNKNSIGPR